MEVEGTSLEGGGGQGREEFHVSITVSTDERTSWGGMLEAQVGALQMEEPPQLVESEAERASAASLPAPHRADAATLLRELPPTRAGIRMRTVIPSSIPSRRNRDEVFYPLILRCVFGHGTRVLKVTQ